MLSREPYQGRLRELVVAFDVGTTYSGVSYAILDPGKVPRTQGVTKYAGHEHVGSDCKIPSIVYYDQHGTPRAFGAEALQYHIIEQAEDEQWVKLEWWKLHWHAKNPTALRIAEDDLPPIPFGKSAVDVLADFMRYLFHCTQKHIKDLHGTDLWKSVEGHIQFVLTHPNGWEGPQQKQIRRAATMAGLVSSSPESQDRIHLLTEGEAILHFCVANLLASEVRSKMSIVSPGPPGQEGEQPPQRGVVIIDAGGGTISLSAYSVKLSPALFQEIAPTECRLQGSMFVTRRATALLRRRLEGSKYCSPEILEEMTEQFDKTTKLLVRNAEAPQYIRLGSLRLHDLQYDIRNGRLRLPGEIVVELFEPSVREIIDAFEKQQEAALIPITSVFLVGGFAASEWLFSSLRKYFEPLNISFIRLDSHLNKAVADGAISYWIDHCVSKDARVAEGQEAFANRRSSQVVFLLMGPTGSGKTNFINTITETSEVDGPASLSDGTRSVTRHVVKCDGRDLVFVDTPGLDNTYLPDVAIFKLIAEWLDTNYPSNTEIEIIYFHRITDNRIQGSPQKYTKMLRGQCGRVAVRQILCLVTTMWDEVDDTKEAERREEILKDEFQRKSVGALFKRFNNQRSSALDIASSLVGDKARRPRKLQNQVKHSDALRAERQFQQLVSRQRHLMAQAVTEGNASHVQALQADLDTLEAQMRLLFQAMRERNISLLKRVLLWFKARATAARDVSSSTSSLSETDCS